jgi:hypothetical protein
MTRTPLVVSALALLLVTAALAWTARDAPDRRTASAPAASDDGDAHAPARDARARPAPARTLPPAAVAAPVREPSDQKAAQELALRRVERIDRAFRDEPRDPAWAAQMEPLLQEALATGEFPGTRAIELGCKSTFCRLEVEHDNAVGADEFEAVRHHIPGSFYLKNLPAGPDGRSRTVAYFLRDERARDNVVYRELHRPDPVGSR